MNELDRIIGKLEQGISNIKENQDKMAQKLDILVDDHNQRKGALRLAYFASGVFGMVGGALSGFFKNLFS